MLQMLGNILPPTLLQFTVPGLKLSGDGFDLFGLLHRVDTDLSRELPSDIGHGNLPDRSGGVFIDSFAEFLQHLDGGADLVWSDGLHDG
jgi:hypothetical protein